MQLSGPKTTPDDIDLEQHQNQCQGHLQKRSERTDRRLMSLSNDALMRFAFLPLSSIRQPEWVLAAQARLEDHRRQLALQDQAINEREQLRSTIRAELQARTRGFKTLAGILLALGIEVEGRHMATSQQLTKAHRKAMLRFHPDRFASAPLAEQVRAEELFKIISHAPKPGAR